MKDSNYVARPIRLGVIGSGDFAQACHLPGLASHPSARVVALCGRRLEQARAVAGQFGVPAAYDDVREMCARDDLDAVTIASPNDAHCDHVLTALQYGKHVLCEKPLAVTVRDARSMRDAALAAAKVHQVAFTFRYNFGVQELRRRVKNGDIGRPYLLRVQYDNWDSRGRAGTGMLLDLGSHLFDIARYVIGPIESAGGFTLSLPRRAADGGAPGPADASCDDLASASFRHHDGTRGQFFLSRVTPRVTANGQLEVIGPEGALRTALSRGKFEGLQVSTPSQPDWRDISLPEAAYVQEPHALGAMMRSFVDACLRGSVDPDLDGTFEDGFAAQLAMEAVLAAQRTGCHIRLADLDTH